MRLMLYFIIELVTVAFKQNVDLDVVMNLNVSCYIRCLNFFFLQLSYRQRLVLNIPVYFTTRDFNETTNIYLVYYCTALTLPYLKNCLTETRSTKTESVDSELSLVLSFKN